MYLNLTHQALTTMTPSYSGQPGTAEIVVKPILKRCSGRRACQDFGLAMNPELLREGSVVRDFLNLDRVVIGVNNDRTREVLEQLYSPIPAPKLIIDIRTAEMIKLVSNASPAAKISLANEIGNLCKRLGVDSWKVLEGVGLNRRIGSHLLRAGLGWGWAVSP